MNGQIIKVELTPNELLKFDILEKIENAIGTHIVMKEKIFDFDFLNHSFWFLWLQKYK